MYIQSIFQIIGRIVDGDELNEVRGVVRVEVLVAVRAPVAHAGLVDRVLAVRLLAAAALRGDAAVARRQRRVRRPIM